MNLLQISNTFNLLVQQSEFFNSYHLGYHNDINLNIPNNFDLDGEAGKMFPHVLWAAPIEGEVKLEGDLGTDYTDVMLYFYNLQGYGNDGDPSHTSVTMLQQWHDLKARALEFIYGFNKSRRFRVKDGKVKYFTDANAQVDRLLCVGIEITVVSKIGCDDYQAQAPPLCADDSGAHGLFDIEAKNVI